MGVPIAEHVCDLSSFPTGTGVSFIEVEENRRCKSMPFSTSQLKTELHYGRWCRDKASSEGGEFQGLVRGRLLEKGLQDTCLSDRGGRGAAEGQQGYLRTQERRGGGA